MPDTQNNRDYGQQFKSAIDHALNGGNFDELNQLVADTVQNSVNGAIDQATEQLKRFQSKGTDAFHASGTGAPNATYREVSPKGAAGSQNAAGTQQNGAFNKPGAPTQNKTSDYTSQNIKKAVYTTNGSRIYPSNYYMPWDEKKKSPKSPSLFTRVGNVSGTLLQVFGGIGAGIFGILLLIFALIAVFYPGEFVAPSIAMGVLTAGSVFFISQGVRSKSVLKRAERYYQMCQKTGYCNISELSNAVGKSEKFVVKEIKNLLAKGAFPQGHLDEEEKCFMLTDIAYRQYQSVSAERRQLAADAANVSAAQSTNESLTEEQKQLNAMIADGKDYIKQIRQKNDAIPGEVFSQKLYRMEELLQEIFKNLEKMPQQMSKMHKLMNYYLPTTLKLVTAYEEFDQMSVQGEDVTSAKKEIENTVDTINDAFGELLNKLFADTAMDVTTDAQVLKTILAREGLTKENTTNKEENEYVYELR